MVECNGHMNSLKREEKQNYNRLFWLVFLTSKITKMLGYFIMAPYLKKLPICKYEVLKENVKRGAKIHLLTVTMQNNNKT